MTFSVLMSVYEKDDPLALKAAVDSVCQQTCEPHEVILVKDGPLTRALDEAIDALVLRHGSLLKIVSLPDNVGLSGALSAGMKECSQELIARMDSDDVSAPDRFEKQLQCFEEEKNLSLVGSYISEFVGEVDHVAGVRTVPLTDGDIKSYLRSRCPFNHMTVMFKKGDVLKAGGYLDWHYNEDYYLWIRMYMAGAVFRNLADSLVKVRVGADMYRRRGGWKYFRSEAWLQQYMLREHVIGVMRCLVNISVRFVVQVLMPNALRGFMFRKFFRKQ